jgi:hypothetical protein
MIGQIRREFGGLSRHESLVATGMRPVAANTMIKSFKGLQNN